MFSLLIEICFFTVNRRIAVHARGDKEKNSQPSHRSYLLPGWQTAAFAAAIPNAV